MLVRNLLRRRTRTLLTLLGIAVGIAAIISLVALSGGIAANYLEITNQSGADLIIQAVQSQEGQAMTFGTGFDESLVDRLRAVWKARHSLYSLAMSQIKLAFAASKSSKGFPWINTERVEAASPSSWAKWQQIRYTSR